MDWKLLFLYLKFFAGIGIIIYAHLTTRKYAEVLTLIGGLIIFSSGITFKFEQLLKLKN